MCSTARWSRHCRSLGWGWRVGWGGWGGGGVHACRLSWPDTPELAELARSGAGSVRMCLLEELAGPRLRPLHGRSPTPLKARCWYCSGTAKVPHLVRQLALRGEVHNLGLAPAQGGSGAGAGRVGAAGANWHAPPGDLGSNQRRHHPKAECNQRLPPSADSPKLAGYQ